MEPVFSVIMTSYNYADLMEESIESVLAQSFSSWELVIVDDCSSDNSWELLQRYANHPRILLRRNSRNVGGAAAYNEAFRRCRGRLVAALDSDDRWLPDYLQRQHDAFAADPELAVAATFVRGIDGEGRPLTDDRRANWFNRERALNHPTTWIWTNPICHSAAVIRRDVHRAVGEMQEEYRAAPDWDLWIRCLASGHVFRQIPEILVESRVTERGVTHSAPDRLSLEYAEISARTLTPLLLEQGHRDAVLVNYRKFFSRPDFLEGGADAASAVLSRLSESGHAVVWDSVQAFAIERHRTAHGLQSALEYERAQAASQAARQRALLEDCRSDLRQSHDRAGAADQLAASLNETRAELSSVYSSTSWRATSLMRILGKVFRRTGKRR